MPARRGDMCFQTPMLPCRIFWPAASSMKNRGTPISSRSITYSKRNAPVNSETREMGDKQIFLELWTLSQIICTSSVLVTQIWEAPHVAEPDAEAHLGEDVLQLTVPRRALVPLSHPSIRLCPFPWHQSHCWLIVRHPRNIFIARQRGLLHLKERSQDKWSDDQIFEKACQEFVLVLHSQYTINYTQQIIYREQYLTANTSDKYI